MKKVGDIMKELGFREEAPNSLKEAFIRHLIRAAEGIEVAPGPNERMMTEAKKTTEAGSSKKSPPQQLAFEFDSPPNKTKTGA